MLLFIGMTATVSNLRGGSWSGVANNLRGCAISDLSAVLFKMLLYIGMTATVSNLRGGRVEVGVGGAGDGG